MNWISAADHLVRNLGNAHPSLLPDAPPAIEEMLMVGDRLMDRGVIRNLRDIEIISGSLCLFGSIVLQGGQYPDGRFLNPRICGGSGFTQDDARVRAYSEAAERYCAAFYDELNLRFDSYSRLKDDAVSPDSFALFSQEQYACIGFPYSPFLDDTRVNWVQGYSLTQKKPVFVPAAFVFLPYWPVGMETPIGLFTSTGLSCGGSFIESALRGIFEVIERDAIMLMWLNQMAERRIDLNSNESVWVKSMANSPEYGTISVFDITTDIPIPTRFALLTDSYRGRSLVSCGAATRWDSHSATEKAVMEALVVRRAVQKIIKTYPLRNYGKDYQKVREIDDHLNFYTNPDMMSAFDFLTCMSESPDLESDFPMASRGYSQQLETCLRFLADRSLEAIVVDVTRPEVADTGLCVLRVIIPGMIPLSFGAQYACAGARRLSGVPRALGYSLSDGKRRPNPVPHPFA